MNRLLATICIFLFSFSIAADEMDGVGDITFPTSGSAQAQEHFLRGVATLHSFGWKQARTAFQQAQEIDPDFAMAYWRDRAMNFSCEAPVPTSSSYLVSCFASVY